MREELVGLILHKRFPLKQDIGFFSHLEGGSGLEFSVFALSSYKSVKFRMVN